MSGELRSAQLENDMGASYNQDNNYQNKEDPSERRKLQNRKSQRRFSRWS